MIALRDVFCIFVWFYVFKRIIVIIKLNFTLVEIWHYFTAVMFDFSINLFRFWPK